MSYIGILVEDGYALIRRVRAMEAEQGGNIPAVALTAYAREEDCQKAIAAGFQVYVSKPVELAQLVAALVSFLGADPPTRDRPDGQTS